MNAGKRLRGGLTTIETIVALSLLVATMSLTGKALVRHHRLLADVRSYRLATDLLQNEIDRLSTLSGDQLAAAVKDLSAPSGIDATLTATVDPTDGGERITLQIDWSDRPTQPALRLVGWSFPSGTTTPSASKQSET